MEVQAVLPTADAPAAAHAELVIPSPATNQKPRLRLEFLDGIRGLAALYVLFFHIRHSTTFTGLPQWFQSAQSVIAYGHYAVCVFIVLSGFCLMLPVARSANGELSGGISQFVRRRARRILPPYYAALVLSLLWVFVFEGMKLRSGQENNFALEFSPGNLLTHLFLVFNLVPAYWGATNGTFWTIATEWQIYFIFALILLPIWRRFGAVPTLIVAFALGLAPHYLLPSGTLLQGFDKACPWFIGLFAFGMLGAAIRFNPRLEAGWYRSVPWGTLSVLCIAILAVLTVVYKPVDDPWAPELIRHYTWITDIICGLATISLILFCVRRVELHAETAHGHATAASREPVKSWLLRLLESRLAVSLSAFSYSLYLTHAPILRALLYVAAHLPLSPLLRGLSMWVGGISISLLVAWLFSRIFEQPFVSSAGPKRAQNPTFE